MVRRILLCLAITALALSAAALACAEEAAIGRLTYVKVFRGSAPEYTRITVDENGETTFQGGPADRPDAAESFRLSAAVVTRLFGLAGQLSYFRGQELESGHRVAFMGQKTLTYEKGGIRGEASYNHTRTPAAAELQLLFDRIARGRMLAAQMEHRLLFDRLGLLETLREFERDFNAGHVVDPEQFVPVLERLVGDPRLMQLARTRAQSLLRRIRGGAATLQFEFGDLERGWYYKIILVDQGSATQDIRRFSDAASPQRLDLPEDVPRRLWELVRLENYFRDRGQYRQPVDQLSGYRLTYEAGPEHNDLLFSTPPTAVVAEMVHLFQQALTQEQFRQRLRAALDTQSLQLQLILQELDSAVQGRKLMAPREFVPLLEGIAGEGSQHPVVRGLAERLLAHIREAQP
ncbi:MAG: hypothetical protein ACRD4D_08690 [Candidatus Acidiferrales bacterium]